MTFRIPAEWEPHACCWMAWAVGAEWKSWISKVKKELESVISTIARFELVKLLTPPDQLADARARFTGGNVEIIEAPVDDIWMRDIAPTFASQDGRTVAIDFNFNSWGNTKERPARPGDRLASTASTIFDVPRLCAPFVAEGGAFVVDGEGTLITTESCLLNPNRNPFGPQWIRRQTIEQTLQKFGIRQVIWLKGNALEPITGGHIDGYVLFTKPGALLVEAVNGERPPWHACDIATIESSLDAEGRPLQLKYVLAPRRYFGHYWAGCYVNVYVANRAVIAPCFGDSVRDDQAKEMLVRSFPDRNIEMLRIDHIVASGGGVRCLTQPMPAISFQKREECR